MSICNKACVAACFLPRRLLFSGWPISESLHYIFYKHPTEQSHKPRNKPEYHHDFVLAPAILETKVVMDRRHPEQPQLGALVIPYLQDDGKLFSQIDEEQKRNQNFDLLDDGQKR